MTTVLALAVCWELLTLLPSPISSVPGDWGLAGPGLCIPPCWSSREERGRLEMRAPLLLPLPVCRGAPAVQQVSPGRCTASSPSCRAVGRGGAPSASVQVRRVLRWREGMCVRLSPRLAPFLRGWPCCFPKGWRRVPRAGAVGLQPAWTSPAAGVVVSLQPQHGLGLSVPEYVAVSGLCRINGRSPPLRHCSSSDSWWQTR